jgi:hypothetical protein
MQTFTNNSRFFKVFAFVIILNICFSAHAKIYLISIPVTGPYTTGQSKSFTINLGESLSQINEVRFICNGSVTAGLSYYWEPYSDHFYGFFSTDPGYMTARCPNAGQAAYPSPEPFSANVVFQPNIGATWDFLLDGQAVGSVSLSGIAFIPEFPPMTYPTGYVSSAQIRIDADPVNIPIIVGDFDHSGIVNFIDFRIFASTWMRQLGDPLYNADCDISVPNDNIIDIFDFAVLAENWLRNY